MDQFNFEIEDIVVWGLGGEDAEQKQMKEKLRERTSPLASKHDLHLRANAFFRKLDGEDAKGE